MTTPLSPIVAIHHRRHPIVLLTLSIIILLGVVIMAVTMTGYHHDDPWPWGTCKIKMQVTTPPPVVIQPAQVTSLCSEFGIVGLPFKPDTTSVGEMLCDPPRFVQLTLPQ